MSYLGSSAAPIPVSFSGVRNQSFSGNGSTSLFTLNRAVQAVTDIEVIVNNVQQSPFDGSYSIINNGLGLQFSENPSAGTNNIYVIYRDQPLGSLYDTGAVRKAGDTMTGGLTVGGNVLASANAGASRVFGVSGGTNTTVVLQAGAASGSGPNLELTADHYAYLDSNTTKFRSTDASLVYGGFDTAGRWTMPNQPAFHAIKTNGAVANNTVVLWNTVPLNRGSSYNSTNGRFTAPIAGTYFLHTHMNNSDGLGIHPEMRVNGSSTNYYRGFSYDSGGGNNHASATAIIQLAAGDYVDVHTGSYGGMQGDPGYNNAFCGYLLG